MGIAFASTRATAVVAGLINDVDFKSYGKPLLVVFPWIAALASGFLALYKFREKEALREEGRIEVEDIVHTCKSRLASDVENPDYQKDFHSLRERLRVLELSQHRRDIALRSDEIPKPGIGGQA